MIRTRNLPVLSLLVLALAACNADRTPVPADDAATAPPTSAPADTTPPPASLPEPGESTDLPVSNPADGKDNQASFTGYGDVTFGTAAADMEKAWGGELRERGKGDNESCYFMTPTWVTAPGDFNFMIGDGKFVRYGTESAKFVAPGGGRIGMSQAQIEALYPGRVEVQPHEYSNGKYLRIKDTGGGNAVLIFETKDSGVVDEFRVGVPPQVDYVEGCA